MNTSHWASVMPPTWEQAEWVTTDEGLHVVRLQWTVASGGSQCIVQRRISNGTSWTALTGWLTEPAAHRQGEPEAWVFSTADLTATTGSSYEYRVSVINGSGNSNTEFNTVYVPALAV